MKRIFAAIKVEPSTRLLTVLNELKTNLQRDHIKWVNPNNVHITMKFFGETEELKIKEIISSLNDIALTFSPFEIEIKNLGIFGSSYKPRVIWIGIEKSHTLIHLANEVLDRMDQLGFIRDRQNFVPHLTLGRIKQIDQKNQFQDTVKNYKDIEIQVQRVNAFYLIESIVRSSGLEYKVIESFDLK